MPDAKDNYLATNPAALYEELVRLHGEKLAAVAFGPLPAKERRPSMNPRVSWRRGVPGGPVAVRTGTAGRRSKARHGQRVLLARRWST